VRFWRGLRRPARFAVLLSGAVPILAFPSANLEWLAWVGLVPGFALIRNAATRREAAIRGWWFGAGYLLAAMYWLAPNIGPGLLLVAIVIGALWCIVGIAVWSLLRPPVRAPAAIAALVVVPSTWLVTEWIRSWQAIGGPWAVLGASQWQHPAVLALAAVGGVWMVSFALVAANTGFMLALVARSVALRLAGLAGAGLAIAAGPVAFALTSPMPAARALTVALVQPGNVSAPATRVARNEQLTAAQAGRSGLFVWGESSVGYDLAAQPALMSDLERLSRTVGAEILIGQDAVNPAGAKSKQATLIGPRGVAGSYVKTRLVPFGEYIPFRSALGWLTKISRAAPENVVPGTGARVMLVMTPGSRPLGIGVLICFESAFPDMSRVDADQGAQLIVYQTSDSTFQDSWGPAQHAALGAVRAAETGRPVVQAALTGDSVAFDGRGRELARVGSSFRGDVIVRLELPPAADRTVYDRLGDYVPWTAVGIAAFAALGGLGGLWSARRRQRVASAAGEPGIFADSRRSPS
jgi:apolipoprotein N-acyltransferase